MVNVFYPIQIFINNNIVVRELSMDTLWHTSVVLQLPLRGCNTTSGGVLRTTTDNGHPRHDITSARTVKQT